MTLDKSRQVQKKAILSIANQVKFIQVDQIKKSNEI